MNIYDELIKTTAYSPAFEKLRKRAAQAPYLQSRAPLFPAVSLKWTLDNQSLIVSELIKSVRSQKIFLADANRQQIFLDKEREIYSQSWPQSIFQSTVCRLIYKILEPLYSPRLFSFRTGTGSHKAIREFSAYIQESKLAGREVFIAKRDVLKYDQFVDLDRLLLQYRAVLGNQNEFVWKTIESFIRPNVLNSNNVESQLPMGFQITPISENLYLHELDNKLDKVLDLFYIRYGDDILLASSNEGILNLNLKVAEDTVQSLGLKFSDPKSLNLRLGQPGQVISSPHFQMKESLDYLGYNINFKGELFLSANKLCKLKKDLKRCLDVSFISNKKSDDRGRKAMIESLNMFMRLRALDPNLSVIMHSSNNRDALKRLDTWIAKQVLRKFHKGAQDKLFRHSSLKQLRAEGLQSLRYLKNARSELQDG